MGWLVKVVNLFQIVYNEETRKEVDPECIPLDNSSSSRPDWFEYWPIREFFLKNNVEDEDYFGFISPRFTEKTGLTGCQIHSAVQAGSSGAEIFSFSPVFDHNAMFANSFAQGETYHPGLISAAQSIFDEIDIGINLTDLVQDQTRIIFSNYFVAKGSLWKKWNELANKVFDLAEVSKAHAINRETSHRDCNGYTLKIFLMERLISVLLEMESINAEVISEIGIHRVSCKEAYSVIGGFVLLDALKGQYLKTGSGLYLDSYEFHRSQIFKMLGMQH